MFGVVIVFLLFFYNVHLSYIFQILLYILHRFTSSTFFFTSSTIFTSSTLNIFLTYSTFFTSSIFYILLYILYSFTSSTLFFTYLHLFVSSTLHILLYIFHILLYILHLFHILPLLRHILHRFTPSKLYPTPFTYFTFFFASCTFHILLYIFYLFYILHLPYCSLHLTLFFISSKLHLPSCYNVSLRSARMIPLVLGDRLYIPKILLASPFLSLPIIVFQNISECILLKLTSSIFIPHLTSESFFPILFFFRLHQRNRMNSNLIELNSFKVECGLAK